MSDDKFGRRSRLRRLALILAAATVLASCVHHATNNSSKQVKGGTGELDKVTWVPYFGEPTVLSIGQATAGYPEATILPNLCDDVLRLTPDGRVEPGLAAIAAHPDPLTYVFRMSGKARFWDGQPVTAADAVFSLRQSIDPTAANAFILSGVKSVAADGADEFVVRLTAPDVAFPEYMASGAALVAEKAYVQAKGKAYGTAQGGVMCSGPFRFKSWIPGQSLTIVRNEHYWDASLEPHVREIQFDFITDPTTLTSALLSGEVDGTFAAPPADLARLRNAGGTLAQVPSLQVASLSAAATDGPMASAKVREALNIAVDRAAVVKAVYDSAAEPVRSAILPPTRSYAQAAFQQAYNALPGATPDLATARRLIDQSGYRGATITIAATATDPASQQLGVYLQSVAESVGLHAKLKTYASASQFLALFYDAKARAAVDAIVNINYTPVPEPLGFLASMALPTGLNNYDGFSDPRVTKLVDEALASTDQTARVKFLTEADALFEPETNNIMLAAPTLNVWQSDRVTAAPVNGAYLALPWGAMLRPVEK